MNPASGAAEAEIVAAELLLQFDIAMDDADAALHARFGRVGLRRLLVTSKGRQVGEVASLAGHDSLLWQTKGRPSQPRRRNRARASFLRVVR